MSKAKFGGGLIADFAKIQSSGKIDAVGIFNQFNAWGFPCNRNWFLMFSTLDVSEQEIIIVSLKKRGKKMSDTLGVLDVKPNTTINQSFILQLTTTFKQNGVYEIIITFKNSKKILRIPFKVHLLPWPEFTDDDIQVISTFKQLPHKINVTVNCQKCSHVYIFEETLLPDEPLAGGTQRFPEDGAFECGNCGHILNLKDIHGMVRSSIKENIISLANR